MAAEKQLIVAVEGTAAVGPFWQTILGDYIEKIVRAFSEGEVTGQKLSDASCEFALVVFNSHGPYSACLVQRSGWTKDVDIFLEWLSALTFNGGGFNESAIADGLSEALLMFSTIPNTNQSQQHIDSQKHCILVAGSNPNPLPSPVPRPATLILDNSDNAETSTDVFVADAETIARSFPQSFVSLSVVAPKQLPKLRAIYNAGKRNPRAIDSTVDYIKNPQFLVLLSEFFLEARLALTQPGMTGIQPNQGTVKLDGPPPTTSNLVNAPMISRQAISTINGPPATVKVEPTTLPSLATSAAFSHLSSVANTTSQGNPIPTSSAPSVSREMNSNAESVQEFKPVVNPAPQPRPVGTGVANVNILNNLSQARQVMNASLTGGNSMGLNTITGTPMAMHMSNMISNGMALSGLSTVASSGLSGMATIPGSGVLMATAPVGQNTTLGSFSSTVSNISGNSSIGMTSSLPTIQGTIGMGQSLPGLSQATLSSVSQMGPNGIGMNQNVMNGLSASSMSSGAGNMVPIPGMSQQIQSGLHSLGPTNGSLGATNGSLGVTNNSIIMPQQQVGGAQQSKYVKIWEGALSGQRQGQPVFICKLEGYRSCTASEKLAEDWPPSMQIVRLISQDHMNNKQYVGKADFLVFRTLNQHGFLGQLQEKKLCAVIQLPSQTLLLSVSEKASRLIGMLFPGDMVVFKPQVSSQQQQLQQQQLQQQTQQLQQQPPQHQPQQLRPQMVGQAMGQTSVQGTGRPQMMPQGMMSQQGPGNMSSGGGFIS